MEFERRAYLVNGLVCGHLLALLPVLIIFHYEARGMAAFACLACAGLAILGAWIASGLAAVGHETRILPFGVIFMCTASWLLCFDAIAKGVVI